jgi:hypothetical protein
MEFGVSQKELASPWRGVIEFFCVASALGIV